MPGSTQVAGLTMIVVGLLLMVGWPFSAGPIGLTTVPPSLHSQSTYSTSTTVQTSTMGSTSTSWTTISGGNPPTIYVTQFLGFLLALLGVVIILTRSRNILS